jgi:hypothetical protein
VWPLALGDLAEAIGEDLDDLPGEACLQLCLLQPGVRGDERVVDATQMAQMRTRGEAEESGGGQDGTECETFARSVDSAREMAADGRAEGCQGVSLARRATRAVRRSYDRRGGLRADKATETGRAFMLRVSSCSCDVRARAVDKRSAARVTAWPRARAERTRTSTGIGSSFQEDRCEPSVVPIRP